MWFEVFFLDRDVIILFFYVGEEKKFEELQKYWYLLINDILNYVNVVVDLVYQYLNDLMLQMVRCVLVLSIIKIFDNIYISVNFFFCYIILCLYRFIIIYREI